MLHPRGEVRGSVVTGSERRYEPITAAAMAEVELCALARGGAAGHFIASLGVEAVQVPVKSSVWSQHG
jgi:hypothetical protein